MAIIAAIIGNLAIAIAKFVAAAFTGSSAMISEAIHSLVDTGVAIFVFAIGGGMSAYEGIEHIARPSLPKNPTWNYAVLGIAFVFEGASWLFGWKVFRAEKGNKGVLQTIHDTKDPTTFSVLLEDSAALLGLLFAFLGILLGRLLGLPYLDGAASIIIGLLLCVVAALMAYETKGLLIGEGLDHETLQSMRAVVERDAAVERVQHLHTLYLGAHDLLLTIELRFRSTISALEVRQSVARIEREIRTEYPDVTHIFFGAESIGGDNHPA